MNLFGLEGIGFIISLAMTLLISGAIMFYCLRRFKVLETNLIEQGNVLKSFIMKQQALPSSLEKSLATPLAVESAKQQSSMSNSKIEVSDDSDSDDYESSDNESSDCCNNDNINIDKDTKQITLTTEELDTEQLNTEPIDNIEVLNFDESVKMIQVENMTELVKELSNSSKNNSDEDVNSDSDSDNDESIKEITSNEELKNKSELVEFIKDNLENSGPKKTNITKMKVDELRDLVVQESKETSENVKNMKKEQLIKLLKEK